MSTETANEVFGRGRLEAIAFVFATLLAALLINDLVRKSSENFEEFALGEQTHSVFARVDDAPIHCQDVEDAGTCIAGWRQRGSKPLALWLGNSQLHAINQPRPGDQTAAAHVQHALGRHNGDLLTFSQPNANLQEHYVLFRYLLERVSPRVLVLPMVFDDTRETGLRPALEDALADASVTAALDANSTGQRILANHRKLAGGDLAALDQTVQQSSETVLNGWLESNSEMWAGRPSARGKLFGNLYKLRNQLLGITAQSKRSVIPGRLSLNLDSSRALIRAAREHGTEVFVYIVPLRDDVETPYVSSQYAAFKDSVARIAGEEGAYFKNLEALIPAELWGSKDATSFDGRAELDFMHFQGAGHALLAETVLAEIIGIVGTPLQ